MITVLTAKESPEHIYKYTVAAEASNVTYGQSVKSWKNWDGVSSITAESDKMITVVECTPAYRAQAAGSAIVVSRE